MAVRGPASGKSAATLRQHIKNKGVLLLAHNAVYNVRAFASPFRSLMILRIFRLSLVAVSLAGIALAQSTPPAAPAPAPAAAPATSLPIAGDDTPIAAMKLSDATLDSVLQLLEMWTGRIILRPQALPPATYTLNIPRPMPKSEAIHALETILAYNQVGVVPSGTNFLKVVAIQQVRTEAPEMLTGSALALPPSGKLMAKVFTLDFLRVADVNTQIGPFLNPQMGPPTIFDKTNAFLITDSVSNLQRVELLLREIDKPSTTGLVPRFYTLRNGAKASDVVNKIKTMFSGALNVQLGTALSYSADDRTGQIILLADPRQYDLFDSLIAKLDIKADPNTRNEVIYLKHAEAKLVAPLLSQLVNGQATAAKNSGGGSGTRPINLNPQPAAPGAAPQPIAVNSLPGATGDSSEFSGLLSIFPDERSNAIVISGTVDDIRLIRELVAKIDIILAQVRIEVIIAEVTLKDTDKSGISALNLTVGPNANKVTQITNFSTTFAGWAVTNGVVNPLAFDAAFADAGSRTHVKILSAPSIMTTHAKEAEIKVGQSQPVVSGTQSTPVSSTTTNTGFSTNSQVQYKDITIDLKVTPLIGDDGSIQLKIDQRVDDLLGSTKIDQNDLPIIGTRQATSFINVYNDQMIVLGGLQRTKNGNDRAKLGFLTEIPIISNLFGSRTKTVERTELLLFIRPHIVPPGDGSEDARKNIDHLSNKDQVDQFLKDPSKQSKDSLIERLK